MSFYTYIILIAMQRLKPHARFRWELVNYQTADRTDRTAECEHSRSRNKTASLNLLQANTHIPKNVGWLDA